MNDAISYSAWTDAYRQPDRMIVLTLGYSTYTASASVISELVNATAHGQIKEVEKRYNSDTHEYEAVIKNPVTVTGEYLKVARDNSAEIKKLEDELRRLRGES